MIGYSQLMKDIFNLDKSSVEMQMEKLVKHQLSKLRFDVLKELAKQERGTISSLLRQVTDNHNGGTYKTIKIFFELLHKDNILEFEKVGVRRYWKFSDKAKDLRNYILSS
ncbi:hypothetical protein ACFL2V_14785 [Pseudomonadota bacterium]